MTWIVFVDIVVAVLLVATIGSAFLLNRRIEAMRRDRGALEQAAASFEHSLRHAEESVGQLKVTGDQLQQHIDKARSVHDDLAFLIERAEALADKLEARVRSVRTAAKPADARPLASRLKADVPADGDAPTEVERELMRALAGGR